MLVLGVAREVDEIADQPGQLLELLDDVGQQRLALGLVDQVVVGKHLDVGTDARDRRSQLMRRVGDELALGAERLVERLEHLVEAAGERGELVLTAGFDAAAEVARRVATCSAARRSFSTGATAARETR